MDFKEDIIAEYFDKELTIDSLPEKVQGLLNPDGFNDFVQHLYQSTDLVETTCYEKAEECFCFIFGKRRYEDYNSYKSSFWQIRSRQQAARAPKSIPLFPEYA